MKRIKKSKFIFDEDTWYEKLLTKMGWYRFTVFLEDWIYPGYYLRNYLFHRYDRVQLPGVIPYACIEPEYQMFLANMNLITTFIEKCHPERLQWYKDGKYDGPRYGDKPYDLVILPEYKNKYIMDIIKEIYHWYKKVYPVLIEDKAYLDSFVLDYIVGDSYFKKIENTEYFTIEHDNSRCPKTASELKEYEGVNWDILNKYFPSHRNILNEKWMRFVTLKLGNDIELQKQKYLYLCIAVRPYLYT